MHNLLPHFQLIHLNFTKSLNFYSIIIILHSFIDIILPNNQAISRTYTWCRNPLLNFLDNIKTQEVSLLTGTFKTKPNENQSLIDQTNFVFLFVYFVLSFLQSFFILPLCSFFFYRRKEKKPTMHSWMKMIEILTATLTLLTHNFYFLSSFWCGRVIRAASFYPTCFIFHVESQILPQTMNCRRKS